MGERPVSSASRTILPVSTARVLVTVLLVASGLYCRHTLAAMSGGDGAAQDAVPGGQAVVAAVVAAGTLLVAAALAGLGAGELVTGPRAAAVRWTVSSSVLVIGWQVIALLESHVVVAGLAVALRVGLG